MDRLSKDQAFEKLQSIKVPEGYTWRYQPSQGYSSEAWVLENIQIKLEFDLRGGGHTSFTPDGKRWLTFDRRGIEDSFYWLPFSIAKNVKAAEPDLNAIVDEQRKKCVAAIADNHNVLDIPGTCFRAHKNRVEEWKKLIKAGKVALMTPAGMGTALHVRSKAAPPRSRGYNPWRRAPAELEAFMGLGPLWVESVDWD